MSLKINNKSCTNCLLQCSKGAIKRPIINFDYRLLHNEIPINTDLHLQYALLFGSFGICSVSKTICKPLVLKIFSASGVFSNGSEVLAENMKAICALGGTITFVNNNF